MMNLSPLRTSLLSAALLLTTALAAPAMAAALPELSPRQIASDVKMTYNPQTGSREFIAPSFDPFEDDRELAGTAQLRSTGQATSINGQRVHGGATLDLTFYYNSGSADPYDNRGYEEAVYLSGEYAPVTRREANVLECSEEIRDVVYYHEDYYAPSFGLNLFRPYRHYSGFNSFGRRGFRNYSPYSYSRGYGGVYRGARRGRRFLDGNRNRTRHGQGRRDEQRDEHNRSDSDNSSRNDRARNRENRRRLTEGQRGLSLDHRTEGDGARRRNRNARNTAISTRRGSRFNNRLEEVGVGRSQGVTPPRAAQPAPQAPTPTRAGPARAAPTAAPPQATERSTPRSSNPGVRPDRPARERVRDRIRNEVRSSQRIKSRNSPRLRGKRLISLSPMTSFFGRNNRRLSAQCAREEKLSLHIPQERLDAARFDGLTVLVLDRSGQELPVFIPPNYIEGFRQASAGSTPRPSYSPSGSTYSTPGYSVPQTAPCPNGTTLQADGTCLTIGSSGSYTGYPTR